MDNKGIKERNDQIKQWLWRYREAKKDVRRFEEELRELIGAQESTGAIEYSDMPKGGGSQVDLSDYMVQREKLWRKIWNARYKRIVVFEEIHDAIEQLPTADERDVIFCRYIKGMDWDDIAKRIGKCARKVYEYHGDGLKNLHIILNNALKCS